MNYIITDSRYGSISYFLHYNHTVYRGQDSVLDAIQDRHICLHCAIDEHLRKFPYRQILLAFDYVPTIESLKANNPEILI